MKKEIYISKNLMRRFISECIKKYPQKAFGYFISSEKDGNPIDYIMFKNDIRNAWKEQFEKYGNYYKIHADAGFLATEEETYCIYKELKERNMRVVGVFHSHQRHPAIFSKVDIDLHPSTNLWHLIISLR